jgi:hypothetical protein
MPKTGAAANPRLPFLPFISAKILHRGFGGCEPPQRLRMKHAFALVLSVLSGPAAAFELAWPTDCALGETCHIQQYFDHDTGPLAQDFTCGLLSYDGHDGTDIALATRAQMAQGVAVLAAAPGVVKGGRDGVADFEPFVAGRECGKGVLIDQAGGWETQYCHLRQGSVLVQAGDKVDAETPLGLIGQSGMADFPHLHLSVRQNGTDVDPFAPTASVCGPSDATLWATPIAYEPGGLLDAGFSAAVPDFDSIRAGLPTLPLPDTAPGLVLWAFIYGSQAGDQVLFQITGPAGTVVEEVSVLEKPQAQLFRAMGKRLTADAWPAGDYAGTVVLQRGGKALDQIAVTVQITP